MYMCIFLMYMLPLPFVSNLLFTRLCTLFVYENYCLLHSLTNLAQAHKRFMDRRVIQPLS